MWIQSAYRFYKQTFDNSSKKTQQKSYSVYIINVWRQEKKKLCAVSMVSKSDSCELVGDRNFQSSQRHTWSWLHQYCICLSCWKDRWVEVETDLWSYEAMMLKWVTLVLWSGRQCPIQLSRWGQWCNMWCEDMSGVNAKCVDLKGIPWYFTLLWPFLLKYLQYM